MKILMVAPEPYFEPRGTPISVFHRLKALSDLGHEIDLLTYHIGKDIPMPGVNIYRIPNIRWIQSVRVGPSWEKLFLDAFLLFKTFSFLFSKKYDLIHSHEEAAFFAGILAKVFSVKHLPDMHSILSRQLQGSRFGNWWLAVLLFEILEKWVIRNSDVILTVGADIDAYVKQVNPASKIFRIDNLPVRDFSSPIDQYESANFKKRMNLNGEKLVVYTGTFEQYQGLDLLLASA